MNHVRGFSSSEDATGTGPQIEYTMKTDTGNVVFTRTPVLDMHVVRDNSTTPAGEIELRGSIGKRAAVSIDLRHIADSLGLTQFSTINRAVIELHVDAANSRRSSLTVDTNGPSLVRITGVGDTARSFYGVMSRDPLQTDVYRITCGNLIELWLRDSTSFQGLEIWSWSNNRYFAVGYGLVDDNTLNRWCFYGTDAADPTKRPRLYVSHSTLK
jgi:hypothetical protein